RNGPSAWRAPHRAAACCAGLSPASHGASSSPGANARAGDPSAHGSSRWTAVRSFIVLRLLVRRRASTGAGSPHEPWRPGSTLPCAGRAEPSRLPGRQMHESGGMPPVFDDLAELFGPRSVVLVGASDRPGSLGRRTLDNLTVHGEFRGELHL